MAVEHVGQVEEGWPAWIARIDDFEQSVKEPIQIDRRCGDPAKDQLVISRIPPAMRTPFRKTRRATWSDGHGLSVEAGGQSSGKHLTVLVLKGMDMKWRSRLAGRKGAIEMQFFYAPAVVGPVEHETLTVMAHLKDKTSITC